MLRILLAHASGAGRMLRILLAHASGQKQNFGLQ
jgi:hypothetical protein